MMAHIVVLGSLNMDLVVRVQRIPRPGETVIGSSFATFAGGKGANQAVAAARLGGRVTMIGQVGRDAFGDQLRAGLKAEGVDIGLIGVDEQTPTGIALIEVDEQGQNSIAVASGANYTLTPAMVEAAWRQLSGVDLLVMPLETPLDAVICGARLARQRGARVILNPAPAQALPDELLKEVDLVIPNEHEAALITGVDQNSEADHHRAAAFFEGHGVHQVLITLGERGVYVHEGLREEAYLLPAFKVKAVDSTAAGDCFVGGLAAALGTRQPLHEAIRFASAAAAISVTRAGAQPGLPLRKEVEGFLDEHAGSVGSVVGP